MNINTIINHKEKQLEYLLKDYKEIYTLVYGDIESIDKYTHGELIEKLEIILKTL